MSLEVGVLPFALVIKSWNLELIGLSLEHLYKAYFGPSLSDFHTWNIVWKPMDINVYKLLIDVSF
jgi:hypothetical protein